MGRQIADAAKRVENFRGIWRHPPVNGNRAMRRSGVEELREPILADVDADASAEQANNHRPNKRQRALDRYAAFFRTNQHVRPSNQHERGSYNGCQYANDGNEIEKRHDLTSWS